MGEKEKVTNMTMIIGIDPGMTGAVTFLFNDTIQIKDLKYCITRTNNFNSVDPVLFNNLLDSVTIPYKNKNAVAYCEESLLIPGNGIKTSRPIYDSRGVMRAVLSLRGIPVTWIMPQSWKSYFNLRKASKSDSVSRILELYPHCECVFYRNGRGGKTLIMDGRAESTLIALYGQHLLHKEKNETKSKKQ
jgi:hypothetical protein